MPERTGDEMLRKVRGKVSHGKIELPEAIDLIEGEEVIVLMPAKGESASLFGLLHGSVTVRGDIVAPVDADWDALR
jgi:hypothetical protein